MLRKPLTAEERDIYEWQMWIPDFGEESQEKLKGASVMISRLGGVGGIVAYELAAAGVGKFVLAHAGVVKPSDLNRQLLMTYDGIGKSRMESIAHRLLDFNPRLNLVCVDQNVTESNVRELTEQANIIIDCAPLFEERFLMNRESVRQNKPMIECAMYEMEARITTFLPGRTPCLHCLYPESPSLWNRRFPVLGAVSGTVGCLGAVEAIKIITGIGQPLAGWLLHINLCSMTFHKIRIHPRTGCETCGMR